MNPAPIPPKPWWSAFFSQYLAPTAIATIIASSISIYTTVNAQHDKRVEVGREFEKLVTGTPIMGAFKGTDVAEEQAASQLLALQAVADSSSDRRTVLLIGARLLNANATSEATGGPAARLLSVLIDQDLRGHDPDIRELIASQSFLDLVTAGYENDYYNDNLNRGSSIWPTLNGDEPITHEAKLALLKRLTPESYDGWLHVATFSSTYHFRNASAPIDPKATTKVPARESAPDIEHSQKPLGIKTATDFLEALDEVNDRLDVDRARDVLAQYAIPASGLAAVHLDPAASAPPVRKTSLPLFRASTLVATDGGPTELVMLKPRLLRNRPPVEFVNPDGTFHKGSLGTITGVVSAASCVKVVEPMRPVLVFVTGEMSKHVPGASTSQWTGLIHMWAHVRPSDVCHL